MSHIISSYIANDRGICPAILIHAVDICSFTLHWLGIKEFRLSQLGASARWVERDRVITQSIEWVATQFNNV